MENKTKSSKTKEIVAYFFLIAVILFCVNLLLHMKYFEGDRVLYLDELDGYITNYANDDLTIWNKIFGSEVLRPIPRTVLWMVYSCCDNNYNFLNWILLGDNFMLSLLVFAIAYKLSKNYASEEISLWLGGISGLLYLLSRFMQCQIFSALGIMEGMAHFFTLLCFLMCYLFMDKMALKYYFLAIFCWLIALYSHERFFLLLIPIICCSLFVKKKIKYIITPICLAIFYCLQRYFMLNNPLRGTGGTDIAETFSIKNFLLNIFKQIAYIFGINADLAERNGINFKDVPHGINFFILIYIIIIIVIIGLAVASVIVAKDDRLHFIQTIVLCLCFITCCMFGSATTYLVAVRFVYASYSLFLIMLATMASYICHQLSIRKNKVIYILYNSMFISALVFELYYRSQIENVGFYKYKTFAESLYNNTVSVWTSEEKSEKLNLIIVNNYIQWSEEKYLNFFQPYMSTENLNVEIYETLDEIDNLDFSNSYVIIEDAKKNICYTIPLDILNKH